MQARIQCSHPWQTTWFFWLWAPLLGLLISCAPFIAKSESRACIAVFVLSAAFVSIVPLVQVLARNLDNGPVDRLLAAGLGVAAAVLASSFAFIAAVHW